MYTHGVDLSFLAPVYEFSWAVIKLPFRKNTKVWSRNSFFFKSYVPGLSDIDISVLSKETPIRFLRWKKFLKIFFPWIGEINWYPSDISAQMCLLANKVELLRDPGIIQEVIKSSPQVTDIDRLTFLIRMIDYDLKGLVNNPQSRIRKWAYHWDHVKGSVQGRDSFLKNLSLEAAIELACEYVPEQKRNTVRKELTEVFKLGKRCDWIMPHKYLNLYDFDQDSCEKTFSELTQGQIEWEFWGVCTQAYWLPKESFFEHLVKLKKIKSEAQNEEVERAKMEIIDYVEKNF